MSTYCDTKGAIHQYMCKSHVIPSLPEVFYSSLYGMTA